MSNLKIITGHSGSGKTEFCINFAITAKEKFQSVILADLDIVNPYFRSREREDHLQSHGIKLIGSAAGLHGLSVDIPAMPPELFGAIDNKDAFKIFDVGGDGIGAKVLSRYAHLIMRAEYDLYLVINANRPETSEINGALKHLADISNQSRLSVSGLINNTHMLRETAIDDVMKGFDLCKKLEERTGIPLIFNVIPKHLKQIENKIDNIFVLKNYYMRPDWL